MADTAPQEILDLLSKAKTLLDDAKLSLISGNLSSTKTKLRETERNLQQVFQNVKQQAEESTQIRLEDYCQEDYCQELHQRVQEKLRHSENQGPNEHFSITRL